jgi:4-hydroxy-tetrahydrodipicolinate reductase
MIKICLAGITGKVGQCLAETIASTTGLELVSAVSRKHAGKNVRDVINNFNSNILISSSVEEALKNNKVDVLIDYTSAEIVKKNVLTALEFNTNVVIGTSGLSDDDYIEIEKLALQKQLGVIAAGNFSLTATLLQHLAQFVAQLIPSWEIIDYAPATKIDSPSGTTKELTYLLKKFSNPIISNKLESTHNISGSRGAILNGSHIHSIRIPGYLSGIEIQFGLNGEKLILKHEAIDSTPYVDGTLLAVRKVRFIKGLCRSLGSLMQFDKIGAVAKK